MCKSYTEKYTVIKEKRHQDKDRETKLHRNKKKKVMQNEKIEM